MSGEATDRGASRRAAIVQVGLAATMLAFPHTAQAQATASSVTSTQGDGEMIAGGGGTRREVGNAPLIAAMKSLAQATSHVVSICTGAAVLARTGLLDGARATTNKRATSQGSNVQWVRQARSVEDGKYFTSSGISAGGSYQRLAYRRGRTCSHKAPLANHNGY